MIGYFTNIITSLRRIRKMQRTTKLCALDKGDFFKKPGEAEESNVYLKIDKKCPNLAYNITKGRLEEIYVAYVVRVVPSILGKFREV
jgi:hypothetical protein